MLICRPTILKKKMLRLMVSRGGLVMCAVRTRCE